MVCECMGYVEVDGLWRQRVRGSKESVDVDVLLKQTVCGGTPTWDKLGTDWGRPRALSDGLSA